MCAHCSVSSSVMFTVDLNATNRCISISWFHGVTASTLDSESNNPSSNLGGTFFSSSVFTHMNMCCAG